ncbi:hypothetical protein B0H11DRAFT_1942273 [Mycena galericulata]|nr:hypothetical protein B0H11DRAFT_1942273 [Mycena galericulata]
MYAVVRRKEMPRSCRGEGRWGETASLFASMVIAEWREGVVGLVVPRSCGVPDTTVGPKAGPTTAEDSRKTRFVEWRDESGNKLCHPHLGGGGVYTRKPKDLIILLDDIDRQESMPICATISTRTRRWEEEAMQKGEEMYGSTDPTSTRDHTDPFLRRRSCEVEHTAPRTEFPRQCAPHRNDDYRPPRETTTATLGQSVATGGETHTKKYVIRDVTHVTVCFNCLGEVAGAGPDGWGVTPDPDRWRGAFPARRGGPLRGAFACGASLCFFFPRKKRDAQRDSNV